jgi:hypothetical protein
MRIQKKVIILLMLLLSTTAYAHGEEVLISVAIPFALITVLIILISILKISLKGKIILITIYLLTEVLSFLLIKDIPYRENKIVINLVLNLTPIVFTLSGYLLLKKRLKNN